MRRCSARAWGSTPWTPSSWSSPSRRSSGSRSRARRSGARFSPRSLASRSTSKAETSPIRPRRRSPHLRCLKMGRMPTTSDSRRVVVTGVGAVCGFGWGGAPLETGLRAGATALLPFSRFDHSRHRTHLAAQVPEPPSGVAASFPALPPLTQADRFALFAAAEAVSQAGLAAPLGPAAGVFFGSSTGGMFETELFYRELARKGGRPRLSALASQPVSGPGDAVGRHLQVAGPVRTISSACSSATLALGAALDAIRAGEVEVAIAGGSDSLCQLTYAGFNSLRAVAEGPCRPFREGRDGMSIGEGAAVFVL